MANWAKANWANCFFYVSRRFQIISIIYIIINNIFIYYLLLTTKTQTCKMNFPNLLLPNLLDFISKHVFSCIRWLFCNLVEKNSLDERILLVSVVL